MSRFWLTLLLLILSRILNGQCDLQIVGVDLIEGTVTVAFNNTTNCGGTGGPDGVSEIQFGFQALDEDCNAMNVGWDFPTGLSTSSTNNHPGWIYSATTTESASNWTNLYDESVDPPYYAGEVVDFPIYNVYQTTSGGIWYQMEDLLGYWIDEGYSIQVVIWQISYGPTMYAADGGWAEVGVNGDGTSWGSGLYEDGNFLDNWLIIGPCGECVPEAIVDSVYVELPGDTIYVLETDTVEVLVTDTLVVTELDTVEVLVTDTVVEYDTTYVQLPPDTVEVLITDTVVEYDTTYVTEYDTTYIYLTDTVVVNDTSYITLTDTVYVTEYQVDTLVVVDVDTLYYTLTDTLYITEYQVDTVLVTEVDTSYITLTDTLYLIDYQVDTLRTYEYTLLDVDCNTGLPCTPLEQDCPVYIPNSFTPNNDGENDVWGAVTDSFCWDEWLLTVYSRSGEQVWVSTDPDEVWLGGDEYYVPDGVYTYKLVCTSLGDGLIINGHVTILR